MSQSPHQNSDSQQPDANLSQEHQAEGFKVDGDKSAVQGEGNRVIQGNSNRAVQGDNNRVIQGNNNIDSQGDGNWFNPTLNFFLSQQEAFLGTQLTRQEYRNRQALLNKVNNFWVQGVLEASLPKQVLIELGLEERPDAVAHPWNLVDEEQRPLPLGTKVIDLLDRIGEGRTLLILGEPGSGKTTTLLELTRDLIARAFQDAEQLIPVVFNLSSWAIKRQKIGDWLVEELNTKYQVPKKIGQTYVQEQLLLLLLDGLDEVRADYREACITALNEFLHRQECASPQIVVCSRIKDYQVLSNRLNFQIAVYLRSLTLEQVNYYLDSVGSDLIGLKAMIEEDRALQELASSPLMLNIMALAYQGIALEDLPKNEMLEERRKQLFDIYIEKMFKRLRTTKQYPEKQAKHWLIWLADQMYQSQTIFLIEHLQPSYLHSKKQFISYKLGIFFISGLISGLITGLISGAIFLVTSPRSSLNLVISSATTMGLLGGIAGGLAGGWGKATIETVETLKWSWQAAWKGLKLPLLCLLVLCLLVSFFIVIILF